MRTKGNSGRGMISIQVAPLAECAGRLLSFGNAFPHFSVIRGVRLVIVSILPDPHSISFLFWDELNECR